MPVTRMNHAVLYVRDAQQSAAFYEEVLGFRRIGMAEGFDKAVFLYPPNCVLLLREATVLCAVVADLFIRAQKFLRIFGCVRLTTLLWDSYFFCVHVDMAWIAPVASTSSVLAVNDDLRSNADIWPCLVSHNVDPISKDAGCCFDPTRAAVVWRSLIFRPRQVVHS